MLKDIADQYNFSCEHLSRLFRKKLGLTFKEYLYSIRLTRMPPSDPHREEYFGYLAGSRLPRYAGIQPAV
ncbi:MAG: helix-turn-helix transcriptional regulator [Coprococcus eutactus]